MNEHEKSLAESTPAADARLVLLPWDSEFFGMRIARLQDEILTGPLAKQADAWCSEHRIECLYFLAAFDASTTRCAEDAGFQLVDLRFTLRAVPRSSGSAQVHTAVIREASPLDLPELKKIAAVSHHDTRFYRDAGFDRTACDHFYETWIENSISGYAEIVFVAESAGKPCGYLTCNRKGAEGQIALLAVSPVSRQTGLGFALVRHALDWFQGQGVESVTVVTQGASANAVRLYQRAGFVADSMKVWYHKWYSRSGR